MRLVPPPPRTHITALRVGARSLVALLALSACNEPVPEVTDSGAAQELLSDAWARHPLVQLRRTLPPGTRFEQVEQIESFDSVGGHTQQLVAHDEPPSAQPFVFVPGVSGAPLSDALTEALDQAEPNALLPIVVWLRTDRHWEDASATGRVEHALFDGVVTDEASYLDTRAAALEERATESDNWADRFFTDHPDLALRVVERAIQAPLLSLELEPAQVRALVDDPAVASMELDERVATEDATMVEVVNDMGLQPFYDLGFDAELFRSGNNARMRLVQFESKVPWADHPGFQVYSSGGQRVFGFDCTSGTPCAAVFPTDGGVPLDAIEGEHATAVAGILAGDNTRGQDPIVATGFDLTGSLAGTPGFPALQDMYRTRHSGIARGAHVYSYALGSTRTWATTRLGRAFDSMPMGSIPSAIASMSASWDSYRTRFWWQPDVPNPTCTETSSMVRLVNTYYEDGGLFVKSAGNWGYEIIYTDNGYPVPACTIGEPGGALGALVVGAVDDAYPAGSSLRSWDSSYSDRNGRAMVKLVAYRNLEYPYRKFGPVGWNTARYGPSAEDPQGTFTETYEERFSWGGTSFSAPQVAATAAVYRDWYMNSWSSFIDEPGMLMASLLLMGDRYSGDGLQRNSGFDSELGAGFLKLDASYPVGASATSATSLHKKCVASRWETPAVRGPSLLQLVPTELTGVIWWYDVDHDEGGALTNYDLVLVRRTPTSESLVLSSRSRENNMERVHYNLPVGDSIANYVWRIEPMGTPGADHICSGSTRVYLAQNRRAR